ncbi:hypothetical protein M440DRAFT_1468599, partial [Trichoderma longibrachiatum ATCC 18648]
LTHTHSRSHTPAQPGIQSQYLFSGFVFNARLPSSSFLSNSFSLLFFFFFFLSQASSSSSPQFVLILVLVLVRPSVRLSSLFPAPLANRPSTVRLSQPPSIRVSPRPRQLINRRKQKTI